VLAGGAARRLGGADKPALTVSGVPMLHRVLAAVADADPRVVVGPVRAGLPAGVRQLCEEPAGGGPVAAVAAGLAAVPDSCPLVAVLAADLPFLTAGTVAALRRASAPEPARGATRDGGESDGGEGPDGAVVVDDDGRDQLLCGVWRVAALRARVAALGAPRGRAVRDLLAGLRYTRVAVGAPGPPPWYDCDTEDDLRRAEEWST
jgi:molybdenum cofactor guanylyltransferase